MKHQPPPRAGQLTRGFVQVEYEELSNYSKYFSRGSFAIGHCSLVEYIGVEWSTRIPVHEHLAYMTEVFDTLASAGNDEAAYSAFNIIAFHILHTKWTMFRDGRVVLPAGRGNLRRNVYHVKRPPEELVHEALRRELLEFIRARFWMMPTDPTKTGLGADWQKNVDRTERFLMLRTRKEMIRQCIHTWKGVPDDENDVLAFMMLSDMSEPNFGICPAPARIPPFKELVDHIHVTLSEQLPERTTWAYDTMMNYGKLPGRIDPPFAWHYWITLGDDILMSHQLRNTLVKNRARLMGWRGAAEDMSAAATMVETCFSFLLLPDEIGYLTSDFYELTSKIPSFGVKQRPEKVEGANMLRVTFTGRIAGKEALLAFYETLERHGIHPFGERALKTITETQSE